eukprot:c11171_g1_i1.p1 GENE.c11171_g1_i1~~c11171_g1_i1.p1  ORF type:complete len:181 (+),score=45.03 c11171_g1_i1:36-578(+)
MDTRRKKGNEKRKELEGELYQFSFSKTDRMTAYRYIFQFDDLVGPSIAKYLMRTFGLGPGCESFHAAYIDHVGEWYRVEVLDCDVGEDSLFGDYRAKVAETVEDTIAISAHLVTDSFASEKKFEVPLLALYPLKDSGSNFELLAMGLEHTRFLCQYLNHDGLFKHETECRVALKEIQNLI